MNSRTSVLSKVYLALAGFLAIAFTVLRTNMLLTAYDAANGFYTNDALHAVFAYPLAVAVILMAVIAYIYIKEEKCSFLPPEGVLLKAASSLAGCAAGGFIIYSFAKAVIPSLGGIGVADLAIMALSVASMLFFFSHGKKATFRCLLCAANALLLLAIVLDLYFDRSVSYVNHTVMLCFAAAIFSALTFTAEANFTLSRPAYRRYIAYSPSAIALSFVISVPDIVFCAANGFSPLTDIYYDVIILAFGIYHLARLTEIAFYKETK